MQAALASQLGVQGYGIFSYILASLTVLSGLIPLGWMQGIQRYVTEYSEASRGSMLCGVVKRSQQLTLISSIVFSIVVWVSAPWLSPKYQLVAYGVALLCPLYIWTRLQQQILLAFKEIVGGIFPVEVLVPGLVWLLTLSYRLQLSEAIGAYLAASMLVALCQGMLLARRIPKGTSPEFATKAWSAESFKLIFGQMSTLMLQRGDVLLLGPLAGMESVGAYSLAKGLMGAIAFGNSALTASLGPTIGSALASDKRSEAALLLRKGATWSTLWALPWAVAFLTFPAPILGYFGPSYAGAAALLQILTVGMFVNSAVGPVGQVLLVGGHSEFWRHSANVVTAVALLSYPILGILAGVQGVAVVTAVCNAGLNLYRWKYLSDLTGGEVRVARTGSSKGISS
jgi:O-antigen/teichoic acid export membrane protein